jgi:hypothetical protein
MICGLRIVLLGAALAFVAACGGGSQSSVTGEPISFEQLAEAASSSADAATGRFEFGMTMTFPGADEPFSFSGAGAFDTTADRASLTFDMSSFARLLGGFFEGLGASGGGADLPDLDDPELWKIEVVQDGLVMYMHFPAVDEKLPAGKSWVRVDLAEAGRRQGFDFDQLRQFTGSDPRKLLEYLRAVSGEIEVVGSEALRGVDTTHYRATVDLRRYETLLPPEQREELKTLLGNVVEQSGVSEIPFDVWIDANGFVRKVTMAFSATQVGASDPSEASMTFELYDYGKQIEIALPHPGAVVDASALQG